jgi:hypothetical protein
VDGGQGRIATTVSVMAADAGASAKLFSANGTTSSVATNGSGGCSVGAGTTPGAAVGCGAIVALLIARRRRAKADPRR